MRSAARRGVRGPRARPSSSASPPSGWRCLLQSLQLVAQGKFEEARPLRERAFEEAPATAGNHRRQAVRLDRRRRLPSRADARGDHQRQVLLDPVRAAARDPDRKADRPARLAWMPGAHLRERRREVALIPTRYPGSEPAADPSIVMARSTEWSEPAPTLTSGSASACWPPTRANSRSWTSARSKLGRAVRLCRRLIHGGAHAKRAPAAVAARSADRRRAGQRQESRDKRILSPSRLRECVRRDLTWLLNTTNLAALQDLSEQPEVAALGAELRHARLRGPDRLQRRRPRDGAAHAAG